MVKRVNFILSTFFNNRKNKTQDTTEQKSPPQRGLPWLKFPDTGERGLMRRELQVWERKENEEKKKVFQEAYDGTLMENSRFQTPVFRKWCHYPEINISDDEFVSDEHGSDGELGFGQAQCELQRGHPGGDSRQI